MFEQILDELETLLIRYGLSQSDKEDERLEKRIEELKGKLTDMYHREPPL